jgi:hypothetical protein
MWVAQEEPVTVWQEQDGVRSGGGAMIRAASFPVGSATRGAVTSRSAFQPASGGLLKAEE